MARIPSLLLYSVLQVSGHGILTRPISRALRAATGSPGPDGYAFAGQCPTGACEWYTQRTVATGTTNCDPAMRTMGVDCTSSALKPPYKTDYTCTPGLQVPWCSPGTAPVKSPCGTFAGGYESASRDMLDLDGTPAETWVAGSVADVGWAISANHGGGYAYRLCLANSDLSEECFQRGHLQFAGSMQRVINTTKDVISMIPARRVKTGTFPAGSEWTRNPIPMEAELEPKVPGLPEAYGRGPFQFSVIDQVVVPKKLAPGHYVLSFRWDAEQTKQVWSQCSDVLVVSSETGTSRVGHGATESVAVQSAHSSAHASAAVCTGASVGLDVADCAAWIDLYDALNGPNWPSEWSSDCESIRTDPCGCRGTWQKKIICSAVRDFGHITELYMLSSNVEGKLPPSFSNLKNLKALSLVSTLVSGSLPNDIGAMSSLEMIWLDHNPLLGGPVPSSLAQLPALSVLELHRSNFSGVLPTLGYEAIADCTLNDLPHLDCPLPPGAASCGAACKPLV